MSKLDEITLGDVGRAFNRYRPFIGVVLGVLLIVAFLPGAKRTSVTTAADSTVGGVSFDADPGSAGGEVAPAAEGAAAASAAAGGAGRPARRAGGGGAGAASGPLLSNRLGGADAPLVANCDPATKRIRMPSRFAAPCVPAHSGSNGGATHRGVTADTIKLVYYEVREDPATDSVLTAAGANDSTEQQRQQVKDWIDLYSAHHNFWGRKIEVEFLPASGETTDDAAARADAIQAAEKMKAFAVINAPTSNVFVDELVARGVMCFCTVSQPVENYLRWAPYVWSQLAASSQLYLHRATYARRLAGKPAKWAGDAGLRAKPRSFGILYYDTDAKAYKPGVDFFISELRKSGINPAAVVEYHGYPQTARSQEEARPAIQKLVSSGATSIICICDPFGPIFMTQEATRQLFRPEWIITGSALTDTSFFGRLYDQTQWSQAFGQSALPGRLPEALSEAYRLHFWHHQKPPSAPASYGVIWSPMGIFFTGVHMAGPKLTPATVRDGLWSMAPVASGITTNAQSYGRHGIWPWDDYNAYDDMTEIWWDPSAEGEDEIGSNGRGLYRYVDMGKRYLPAQWPNSEPRVFDRANTATIYDKPPAADQYPDYPPPKK